MMPDEIRIEAAKRYIQAYELVTGLPFKPVEGPIRERVQKALEKLV